MKVKASIKYWIASAIVMGATAYSAAPGAQTLSVIHNETVNYSDTIDSSIYKYTTYWLKCHTSPTAPNPVDSWDMTLDGHVVATSASCQDTQITHRNYTNSSLGFILHCTAQDGTSRNCGRTEITSGRDGHSWDYSRDVDVMSAVGNKASATIPDSINLGQHTIGETVVISLPVTVDPEGSNLDVGQGLASGGALHIPLTDEEKNVYKDDLTATTSEGKVTDGYGMDFKKSGTINLKWKPSHGGNMHGTLTFKLTVN